VYILAAMPITDKLAANTAVISITLSHAQLRLIQAIAF
jgi:hypothetical protein